MRKMKNSGIEWIGEMPEKWAVQKVKLNFSIISGNGFKEQYQGKEQGDYPFCKASDINGNEKIISSAANYVDNNIVKIEGYNVIPPYSIIMAKIGEALKKNHRKINAVPCIIDNNCQALAQIKNNNLGYLYYLLTQIDMSWFDNSGTVPCVNNTAFKNSYICLPPLPEQQQITDYLNVECSKIDSLVSDIESQITALEQYKRSVITETVTKGLDPTVPMKDSGVEWIGEIPETWECVRGKYILEYLQKPVRNDDDIITCFRDGEVTLRSNRREDGFTMSDKEIGYQGIDVGDLVVHGMDGFAGAIGISDSRGKASPVLNVLKTGQSERYIMYYLRSMAYGDVFTAIATGIRVRSCDLRWNKLAELSYPVSPLSEQENIVEYIDTVLQQTNDIIANKKQQIEALNDYKKSLIYEYVTGKKEIPA